MNDIKKIFISRIEKESAKRSSYNKYIFNSHLVMFLMVSVGAAMFNYSKWLKTATSIQLYLFLFLILSLMAYFLTILRIKTFIRRADSVFILPLENRYKELITSLAQSTIVLKVLISFITIVIIYPLTQVLEISKLRIFYLLLSLVLSSIFITIIKQYKVIYNKLLVKDSILIFVIYLVNIIYFSIIEIFNPSFVLAVIYYLVIKNRLIFNINWQEAAEYDEARNEKYLKFVNMFTDVPMDNVKVSRRKYLDVITPKLSEKTFNKKTTYSYYYLRAFFRQENSIFLLIRLFLVAVLFVYGLKNIYATAFIIIAFNYLTLIQLIPLYKKLNSSLWFYILPVGEEIKVNSFRKMMFNIMLAATLILALVAFILINVELNNLVWIALSILGSVMLNSYFLRKLK